MDSGWPVLFGLWLCGAGFGLSLIVHVFLTEHSARSIALAALTACAGGVLWAARFFGTGPAGWPLSDVAWFCAYLAVIGLVAASIGAVPGALIGQVIRHTMSR